MDLSTPILPPETDADAWTSEDAEALYHVEAWSDGYFFVNDEGEVSVATDRSRETGAVSLAAVVRDLRAQGVATPVVVRFQDVLHGRVRQLNEAFRGAIQAFDYGATYTAVYPIKVNQLHEVVEEVLEAGRPYGMGLECGSKAELVATLAHLEHDDTLLICNGYKDEQVLRLVLTGQALGKRVVPVIEKPDEFERFLALAEEVGVRPKMGVRVALSTPGSGRWAGSSGDRSKFGVSIPELLRMVQRLEQAGMADALTLLHFHIGSQIADIQTLKRAAKEVAQVYAHLHRRGVGVTHLDVGGGLGVNYEVGYAGGEEAINYTLEEYANSVVYAVKEVCDAEEVPHPHLVSESGRALTAHHSVLVVDVLGQYRKEGVPEGYEPPDDAPDAVRELYDVWQQVAHNGTLTPAQLLEAYHDAQEHRNEAGTLFRLGYLELEALAEAERLFWSCCRAVHAHAAALVAQDDELLLPTELADLDEHLTDQVLCDFSVFQSLMDHWAIGQRFPVMPIERLREAPTRRAVLVDLTCDSDGKVGHFIAPEEEKRYLELHELREGEPYALAFFLVGAYQDILGDAHNLFGRVAEAHVYADADEPEGYYIEKVLPAASVKEMLAQVQYFPNDLQRRMRSIIQAKIKAGELRSKAGMQLLEHYASVFQQHTYLNS